VAYAQIAHNVDDPKVGLLTIGAEPGKGNKLTRRAHELLAAPPPHGAPPIRFTGNVEGTDLLSGSVDVIVTDGFTGNVALKTLEGAMGYAAGQLRDVLRGSRAARAGAVLQRRGLRELRGRLDAESQGGAALLGLEGTIVIAHGASSPRGITSACLLAADLVKGQITEKIRERLGHGRGGHFLRRSLPSHRAWPTPGPDHGFIGAGLSGAVARLKAWRIPGMFSRSGCRLRSVRPSAPSTRLPTR
jgi:phosphate acyltransferase